MYRGASIYRGVHGPSMVEETSDVMMVVEAGFFLELSEIYRQVRMHQANRSQYAPAPGVN